MRTLDGYDGAKAPLPLNNGILSRSGWSVIDESPATVRPDGSRSLAFENEVQGVPWVAHRADPEALDIYLLGYGNDYMTALGDYTRIAGKMPMPPAYVLGYWYSKFAPYSAEDYRTMIRELSENDINIDVMILDVDWHWDGGEPYSTGRGAWTGWTWNTNLIPDPEGLLSHIHDKGLHLALNLHPADGVAHTTRTATPKSVPTWASTRSRRLLCPGLCRTLHSTNHFSKTSCVYAKNRV